MLKTLWFKFYIRGLMWNEQADDLKNGGAG